jgi:hypothetical protein
MTMKRCLILLIGVLAVAGSLGLVRMAWWGTRDCPVDVRPETRAKLQIHMSEKEVEAILGGPAGDYRTRPNIDYAFVTLGHKYQVLKRFDHVTERKWHTDEYAIHVYFDPDGKAILIASACADPPLPSECYPPPLRQMLHPFVDP